MNFWSPYCWTMGVVSMSGIWLGFNSYFQGHQNGIIFLNMIMVLVWGYLYQRLVYNKNESS